MKDLKDQVKDWKKTHPESQAKPQPKRPLPSIIKPAPVKSDEELFREAVAGVDQRAVEKKYDDTPPAPPPPVDKKAEESLFAAFVGKVDKKR